MRVRRFIWPVIGVGAVIFSVWLLYHELREISFSELMSSFAAIPPRNWILAGLSTLVAYAALAGYDRIALMHLNRHDIPWLYIAITSFTTYALSHNIGASMLSGAVIRYRAYAPKGLSAAEVGLLVAFCSFTFVLGVVFLLGVVLVLEPGITARFVGILPVEASSATGYLLLGAVALYVTGSAFHFRPLRIGSFALHYPRLPVVLRQLIIGPIELIGAAGIVYFALPAQGNPGYLVVLGIFLISFSTALISHAPGGLGVLELVFLTALDEMDPAAVLAALVVFRLLYLIVPLVIALFVVLIYEHSRLGRD